MDFALLRAVRSTRQRITSQQQLWWIFCRFHTSRSQGNDDDCVEGRTPQHPPTLKELSHILDRRTVSSLCTLTASQFVVNAGFAAVVPVLPAFAASLGLGATGVGIVLALPSASRVACNLHCGAAADAVGRRPLMVGGAALASVAQIGTAFASGLPALIACRLVVGAGGAASSAGSSAMLADITDKYPRHRAQIMGVQQGIIGAAFVAGPALGGWLASGQEAGSAFVVVGVGAAVCAAGYALLPETLPVTQRRPLRAWLHDVVDLGGGSGSDSKNVLARALSEWQQLAQHRGQRAAILMNAALWLTWAAELSVVTVHAVDVWGATPQELGMLFAVAWATSLVGTPLGGWLADRFGRKAVIVPAFGIATVALGSIALSNSWLGFAVPLGLWSFAGSIAMPALSAYSVEVSPLAQRGQALALQRQASDMVWVFAPIGLGFLADAVSTSVAIAFAAGSATACVGIFSFWAPEPDLQRQNKNDDEKTS